MAGKRRFGQKTWHFSDAGNKFDGRPRNTPNTHIKPISPALKRGVIRCSRCGSRVVSNLDNCPFCGKSLKPFFARLWFWIIVVIVVAVTVIILVNTNLPQENPDPPKPNEPVGAQVVGQSPGASIKELAVGTTIAVGDLQVKLADIELGPVAANNMPLLVVSVEFNNKGNSEVTLYSTQWLMHDALGKNVDTFVGTTVDGATITPNFEAYSLAAGGRFTGRLYFAGNDFTEVVFQPSALAYSEELLVTWKVPTLTTPEPA